MFSVLTICGHAKYTKINKGGKMLEKVKRISQKRVTKADTAFAFILEFLTLLTL